MNHAFVFFIKRPFVVASLYLFSLAFISCDKLPSTPESDSANKDQSGFMLRTNESIEINYFISELSSDIKTATWTCSQGKIIQNKNGIIYQAPENPCESIVRLYLTRPNSAPIDTNFRFLVYRQFVILKADDFLYDHKSIISPEWKRYLDYLKKSRIKSSIGLIGSSLVAGGNVYADYLKTVHHSGYVEIWNHGYTHYTKDYSSHHVAEFCGTGLDDQYQSLNVTQSLARELLGINIHTFGAPANAFDENTLKLINDSPDILVWFFGPPQSSKFILPRSSDIEHPIFHPNFAHFSANYDAERPYQVYQVHPDKWSQSDFDEFKRIIEFLNEHEVSYIKPFEYYLLMKSNRNRTNARIIVED